MRPFLKGAGGIKMRMLQIIFGRGGQGAQPPGPPLKGLSQQFLMGLRPLT